MNDTLQHIITRWASVLCIVIPLASCSNETSIVDEPDKGKAILVLNTDIIGTRAGDGETSEEEKMKTLRIIVLHSDGTVEANRFFDFAGNPFSEYKTLIPVKRNETKKIYLVANERSLGGSTDLSQLGENPTAQLEGITFEAKPSSPSGNPELAGGIPMSACYSLTVGEESQINKEFWLVRAMTKFTFTFQNGRTDGPVRLNEMKVSAFADKMYLMPHLHDGENPDSLVSSEEFMVNATGNYQQGGTFWIDWLKEAVGKSQAGEQTADEIGWISQYSVPDGVLYSDENTGIRLDGLEIPMGGEVQYPTAFYRCESSHPSGADAQAYRIESLSITDGTGTEKTWTAEGTPALKLGNVRYLFRHTHVKVNVVFNQKDVAIFARIHPWKRTEPTAPRPLEPID